MSSDPTPPLARRWPCRMRRLTPDEVLEHLRAFCRNIIGIPEEEVARNVVPDAPVSALGELASDFDWVDFGPYFGLDLDQAWYDRWHSGTTVADLCADLAGRIEVPVFEPVTMLGRECETAGAFLAIRNMLAADGADVRELGPSSPLAPYLRRHPGVFDRLRFAARGPIPNLQIDSPAVAAGCWLVVLVGLTALFTWAFNTVGVAWPDSLLFALVGAGTLVLGLAVYSRRAAEHAPAVNDFRQLVYTLLGRTPRTA